MTNTPLSGRQQPPTTIDANTLAARPGALASAGICPGCQQAISPLTGDVKAVLAEVIRLRRALNTARLESANGSPPSAPR